MNWKFWRRKPREIKTEKCYHTEGYSLTGGNGGAENFICGRCGALVNNTPFGKKLLVKDARTRYPDAEKRLKVDKWEQERKAKEVNK